MNLRRRYCAAKPFAEFLRDVQANADLWRSLARRAHVPEQVVERVRALGGRWHLLVLVEDWCGDAVNTLPVLARLAELADNVGLRVRPRVSVGGPQLSLEVERSVLADLTLPERLDEGRVNRLERYDANRRD
ncbi:MAG: thioredoxin family protein [Gemmatimonadaceae bacterium]